MTAAVVDLAAVLLLPWLAGAGLLRMAGLRFGADRLAWPALCWIAGALLTGLLVFAWLFTGGSLADPRPLQGVLCAVALLGWVLPRRRPAAAAVVLPGAPAFERRLFHAVVVLAVLVTAERALVGNLQPLVEADETEFWALKAKAIHAAGGFNASFAAQMAGPAVHHEDYPLLNPLLQVWTFMNAGRVTHVVNRVPMQAFAGALILLLAAALRRLVRPGVAATLLLAVLALRETADQSQRAHADLMVALALVVVLDAWHRWRSAAPARRTAWWCVLSIGLAVLLWSKNEGLLDLAALGTAALLCARREPRPRPREILLLLLPAGIAVLTWTFNAAFGFENDILAGDTRDRGFLGLLVAQFAEALPRVLGYLGELAVSPAHGLLLLAALLAVLAVRPGAAWRSDLRFPVLALLLALGGLVLVFTGTPHPLEWHLATAAPRVLWQLLPATTWCLALAWRRLLPPWFSGTSGVIGIDQVAVDP